MLDLRESIDLLKRMNRLGLNKGENEYINEASEDAPDYERGIIRKVKYSNVGRKLKLEFAGKILYINLPNSVVGKDNVFDFVSALFKKINQAIFPIKLEPAKKEESKNKKENEGEEEEEEAEE